MPTYAYRCTKCEHLFEEFHGIRDTKPRKCPKCGAKSTRVPGGGAGQLFKGSGFYITDYRSSSYKEKARKESGGSGGDKGSSGSSGGSGSGGKKSSGD
jgi:putative FmdB family regulatory protein